MCAMKISEPRVFRPGTLAGLCGVPLVVLLLAPAAAAAQDEAALRSFFEGTRVTLKIDMPGAADGVDVRPGRSFDSSQYSDRLRRFGTSIRRGEPATITLVKVKRDLIEFQLDGGGYGTFGDDTSTNVDMPDVQKSNRERDLERLVKDEPDPGRRRQLQKELDDVRNARERENRRIASERALAEDHKRAILAERRMSGGSRFNIRYASVVPVNIHPEDVVAALAEYVDFSPNPRPGYGPPGPPISVDNLRKGLWRGEVERQFGSPADVSERREGTLRVAVLVFLQGDQRITMEFVEDILIRYSITPR
jgi:hypothetical protein